MATGGLYGNSGTGALIAQPGAETPGLYGKSPNGSVVAQPGSESAGLYGNGTTFGGYYFEWFVFQTSATQPATPTGGSWNFQTDAGTAPSGWTNAPASNPTNPVWISIALVNSRSTSPLVWSTPGVLSYSGTINGSGAPTSGVGQIGELYIQTGVTPNALWFKSGSTTWTQITGSALYVDLTSNQTIAGTKTFSSTIQGNISGNAGTVTNGVYTDGSYVNPAFIASLAGSKITGNISGNAANVTGTVAVVNGGTGATTASGARTNLGLGTIATQDASSVAITGGSITGITDLAIADGGTGASTAGQARINLGLGTAAVLDAGVANGVATLDAGGTVPLSQIPASIQGGVSYQGAWNASTNTPTLTSSVGTKGYYYVVSVAGSTNLNGVTDWVVGDWAIFNGTIWQKIDNTDLVSSVNGQTGTVVLGYADLAGAVPTWNQNTTGTASNVTGVVAVANGGTGVTSSSGANSVVLRDANANITANNLFDGFSNVVASGTTTVLTASSVPNYVVTGSGGQTYQLPNATTLPSGASFSFNNNQSSGALIVNNNSGTLIVSVPSGGFTVVSLLSNAIAAGSWDIHDQAPSNVSWSTNTLSYAGSITNATWNGNVVQVNRGGTGASTLTGYVKGSGTTPLTASATIPSGDITGLGTMSTQNATSVAITGGTINGTTVGATTASTGRFSDLTDTGLTSGRVVYASTGGNLVDASNFTYDGTNLVAGAIQNTPIGATTPATGVFTTLTAQTEVLTGTGQNFLTFSQTFQNAIWTKQTNVTATDNTTLAPDGTTTAATIAWGSASNATGIFQAKSGLSWTGVTNTKSIYVRADVAGGTVQLTDPSFTVGTSTFTLTTSWQRVTLSESGQTTVSGVWLRKTASSPSTIYIWGGQLEIGTSAGTYTPTTTTAVYGTPTLSFSGVSTIGLESNGSLFVQPAGTGALQAQATTSSAVGGNVRGANAVDWQTTRDVAARVASGGGSVVSGGYANTASIGYSVASGGFNNTAGYLSSVVGGQSNSASGTGHSAVVGGQSNTANGYFNFVGGGFTNSGTSSSAVTTQSATMNGTTAVTLSGSNANIKVGQLITGTSIATYTYVAAISGTSLTLSQAASGSSTSTLSFYTPHGVVVGGGNNQATGSYSFIGGGGDAGTAANRNVASGDWSVVAGGIANQATGIASFVGGGGGLVFSGAGVAGNLASGGGSFVGAGMGNTASGIAASILGSRNIANSAYATALGTYSTTRSIAGNVAFGANQAPLAASVGLCQAGLLVLATQTTDATATVLASTSSAASTTNQVILPNNSAYYFKGSVIANVTGAANGASWSFEGAIMRGANAASTVLIGTPAINRVAASSGATAWVIALTADTTNGGLAVTVTGAASTTIRWVASVNTVEVTF